MNTFFANKSHFRDNKAYIDGEDYHHIKNVLRMKTGEDAYICDDDENKYLATLASFTDKEAEFYIISKCERVSELPVDITLYQGLPRQERFELVIQKSSELGVNAIVPTLMDRCVVKLSDKEFGKKLERWQKIAKEASRTVW